MQCVGLIRAVTCTVWSICDRVGVCMRSQRLISKQPCHNARLIQWTAVPGFELPRTRDSP